MAFSSPYCCPSAGCVGDGAGSVDGETGVIGAGVSVAGICCSGACVAGTWSVMAELCREWEEK